MKSNDHMSGKVRSSWREWAARLGRVGFWIVFWSWNALFLFLLVAGLVPFVMLDLVADAVDGLARWTTVGWTAVLFFLPIAVVVATMRRFVAGSSGRSVDATMFVTFFGVEIPVVVLATVRLFGLPDLQGAASLTVAAVTVGSLALLAWLIRREKLGTAAHALVHAGLAVFVVAALYLGAVLALVTLPALGAMVVEMVHEIVRKPWVVTAAFVPMLWAGSVFVSVAVSPVFTPIAAAGALRRSHHDLAARLGTGGAIALTVAPAALFIALLTAQWRQPYTDVRALLETPPANDAERRAILADERAVRAGLVDGYLASHRYLDDERADTLGDTWGHLGLDGLKVALAPLHRSLAQPFFFAGDAVRARDDADALYRALFGEEIERREREAIRSALASNARRDQRYAGFMNEGEERVWLAEQRVTVEEHDGWAVVEIGDTWMNQTANDEEVLLSFSLPPDAAITGLWLGTEDDKEKAFTHVVAPRGAAQQVYNEQVQARRDPALLEQVGPQQYRLRVFPVPARTSRGSWHDREVTRPRMHVWLRYEALLDDEGRVPWPLLAERRNGFWDDETRRSLTLVKGGEEREGHVLDDDEWVPLAPLALRGAAGPGASALRARVGDACAELSSSPVRASSLAGRTLDVVIDRSYGMSGQLDVLREALEQIGATGASLRFVLTAGALRGEAPTPAAKVDVDALVPFGATSPREMLEQWARVRAASGWSAPAGVVVLAARGSFDVATDGKLDAPLDAPLFLVHLGGLPAGYDDGTADALARSGGTAVDGHDLGDVLHALGSTDLLVAGRRFARLPAGTPSCDDGPRGVLARLMVRDLDRTRTRDDPTTLDALHRIAVGASVVTPYSSMIVLVDEQQRRRLAELEKQDDRFQREVEQHKETTPAVVGVPEPHEWLLLALALVFLVVVRHRLA